MVEVVEPDARRRLAAVLVLQNGHPVGRVASNSDTAMRTLAGAAAADQGFEHGVVSIEAAGDVANRNTGRGPALPACQ